MKKYIALLLTLVMALGLLAGCAKEPADPTTGDNTGLGTGTGTGTGTTEPVTPPAGSGTGTGTGTTDPVTPAPADPTPAEPKVFKWVVSSEASCLNPHDCNAGGNLTIVDKTNAGLYGFFPSEDGQRAELLPVLADGVPTTTDGGTTWVIKLRKDATWSTGEPITAQTFLYSWKTGLDPLTMYGSASNIASNYIKVKNGQEYYKQGTAGTVKWEDVGFKALDDYTLEITCTDKYTELDVMRHFYMRYTFPVKEDLYEKCYSADRTSNDYGTELAKCAFNGPYYLSDWVKGASAILTRNESFVKADLVNFETITYREVSDESTRLELFESGESDLVDLGTNGLAKYGEDPRVRSYAVATIREIQFNHNNPDKPYLADPTFRKAIYYAVDRTTLAKLSNYLAAPFYLGVTGSIKADGTMYRDLAEAQAMIPANNGYDETLAKKYFDETLTKYNLDKIDVTLIYVETKEGQRTHSEYLMNEWNRIFGGKLNVTIQAYALQASLDLMKTSVKAATAAWDMCWSSIGLAAEPFFPWKRCERYTSTNSSRYTAYNDSKLDALIKDCTKLENRLDENKMLQLTLDLEAQMFEQCPSVPVLEETKNEMFSEHIVLPMERYISSVGWGWIFGDVK